MAAAVHLSVGYFFLVSRELVFPPPLLLPMWFTWLALAGWLVWTAILRSWSTLAVPVIAAVVLTLMALGGSALFGWTA